MLSLFAFYSRNGALRVLSSLTTFKLDAVMHAAPSIKTAEKVGKRIVYYFIYVCMNIFRFNYTRH